MTFERTAGFGFILLALTVSALLPPAALAQTQGATIAGTVRDPAGARLPGVRVEASSPALIERTRTAITDGQGTYRILKLRPGTYTVTFALAGFNTHGQTIVRTRYGEAVTQGFGVRPYHWGASLAVQHELFPRVSVNGLLFTLLASWPATADTGFLDRSVTSGGETYRYQVYVPSDFDSARSWPVVVYLHGNGEQGSDGLLPTVRALADVIRRHGTLYPAVVVFPQARIGTRWVDPRMQDMAMAALDRTLEEFHGDPDRVYLAGHSAGGGGVYRIAYRYPQRFAALLATAGPVESNLKGAWSPQEIETDRRRSASVCPSRNSITRNWSASWLESPDAGPVASPTS